MAASLQRHRRAILFGVVGLFLAIGEARAMFSPPYEPLAMKLVGVYRDFLPPFVALYVGVAGLIAVLVARRGEPLDRRPTRAALTAVSLLWLGVYLFGTGRSASALASVIGGGAFLVRALVDWTELFAMLRSKTLVEHRDGPSACVAPPIVSGMKTPVALFEPATAAYRENAKGAPIVAVPLDRAAAQKRLAAQMVVALACAFVAVPASALAVTRPARGCALRTPSALRGTTWQGQIDDGSLKYSFTLQIESDSHGEVSGVMDWGDVAANVEGHYTGDTLVFYDRSIRRTNGAPFLLHERKQVQLDGDQMWGTDKDGRATLYARRVR